MVKDNYRTAQRAARCAVAAGLALATAAAPAYAGTVRYDLNGVAGVVHEHTEKGEVEVEEIAVDFDGLAALTGWNTRRDGTGKAYAAGDGLAGDATLYAQYADGTMLATDLVEIGGKTYYYKDGSPQAGLIKVEGLAGLDSALAYFDPDDGDAMARADTAGEVKWIEVGGKTYAAESTGALVGTASPAKDGEDAKTYGGGSLTVRTVGGKSYLFGTDGAQREGAATLDGKTYLFLGAAADGAPGGYMVTGALVDAAACGLGVAGARVYPTADGLACGIVDVADDLGGTASYFFGEDGVSSAGWHKTAQGGAALWVYTGLDGKVMARSADEPVAVDRDHLGGSEAVKNPSALAGMDEYRVSRLGDAVERYMSLAAPAAKGHSLDIADGASDEEAVLAISFGLSPVGTRTDTVEFRWDDASGEYKATVLKSEVNTPSPDKDKDTDAPGKDEEDSDSGSKDNEGAGGGATEDGSAEQGKNPGGTGETEQAAGAADQAHTSAVVARGGTADDGTNVKSASGSTSSGNLPQTGVSAAACALVAGGTAAAGLAGGKLAWDRLANIDEDGGEE